MSRRRALRYGPGWTPFAGQLTLTSQQHALTVVGALFRWMVAAHYLRANPWELVKTRLGDDSRRSALDSRAFTPAAWAAIVGYVQAQPPSPAQARAAFVLHFVEGVGLRSEELVSAEMGQFRQVDEGQVDDGGAGGWAMQIHGKGARKRVASVPPQAVRALDDYLAFGGLTPLGRASPSTPLVASVDDPCAGVGYRALYDRLRPWILGTRTRARRCATARSNCCAARGRLGKRFRRSSVARLGAIQMGESRKAHLHSDGRGRHRASSVATSALNASRGLWPAGKVCESRRPLRAAISRSAVSARPAPGSHCRWRAPVWQGLARSEPRGLVSIRRLSERPCSMPPAIGCR
jgi:integrase